MIEITKTQMEYLISRGYLRLEKGKYVDLIITSRKHGGKRKKRYVPWTYEKFL